MPSLSFVRHEAARLSQPVVQWQLQFQHESVLMTQSNNGTDLENLHRTKQNPQIENPSTMNPTTELSDALTGAYDFFNERLFHGALPPCVLIVNRRSKRTYGYFIDGCWEDHTAEHTTHEISLNPDYFHTCSTTDVLSTLVHEQCHLHQHIQGKTGRGGYHNKQFAQMMKAVGLICSETGQPEGKNTGQRMSHYVEEGGVFEGACQQLIDTGYVIPWHTVLPQREENEGNDDADEMAKKKRASKTKYSCPTCSLNAWAKPEALILCGDCHQELVAAAS